MCDVNLALQVKTASCWHNLLTKHLSPQQELNLWPSAHPSDTLTNELLRDPGPVREDSQGSL